jgi:hypothetical protein
MTCEGYGCSASGIIADGFAKATKLVNYFINGWRSPIQMGSASGGPLSRCKSSTEEKLGKEVDPNASQSFVKSTTVGRNVFEATWLELRSTE